MSSGLGLRQLVNRYGRFNTSGFNSGFDSSGWDGKGSSGFGVNGSDGCIK
jgi:hypothetical protein